MKGLIRNILFSLLTLSGSQSFAQYDKQQIDSIFDVANHQVGLKSDIQQLNLAYNASKAINYEEGIIKGLILYSKNSYDARQYDKAFHYITQAENVSPQLKDPVLIFNIRILKAQCYENLGFYQEAKEIFQSLVPVAESIRNEEDRHYYLSIIYSNIGINDRHFSNKPPSGYWSSQSYAEAEKLQHSDKYLWLYIIVASNRANLFTVHKQYDSAEVYTNKALLFSEKCTDKYKYQKYYARWVTFSHAGNFYYAVKKYTLSAAYYKKAEDAATQIKFTHGLQGAYTGLAKVYTVLNKPKEALIYFEKSNKLTDSLAQADKAALKTPLEYIVGGQQRKLAENGRRYRWIIWTVSILLSLITCVVFFYRSRLKKEQRLSHERLNELVRKIELNEQNRSPSKIEELKEVIQLAVHNNPAFFLKFNEFDPKFNKKLLEIAPNLVATEVEFCAFLRLNFETKEIARYSKISVRAVEGKKYRIRKKLGLQTDQDINIWMSNI